MRSKRLTNGIDLLDRQSVIRAIEEDVNAHGCHVFVGLYAASYYLAARNSVYRRLLEHTLNYPDGTGVVWALRRRGVKAERCTTTDLIHNIMEVAAVKKWSVFLYGGAPGVAKKVAEWISANHSGINIVGVIDGYLDVRPNEILEAAPDLVLVARGAPLQESWAVDTAVACCESNRVGAFMACGGLFDFLSGYSRRAPRWMQHAGLEWLFRSLLEPRRLLGRYLRGNTWFTLRYLIGPYSIAIRKKETLSRKEVRRDVGVKERKGKKRVK